jgi:hypothetical protein
LYVRATASRPVAAPGTTVDVTLELVTRGSAITVQRIEVPGAAPITTATPLASNEKKLVTVAVPLSAQASPSIAYWLAQPSPTGHYVAADAKLIGMPRQASPIDATIELVIGGRPLRLIRPVVFTWTDRVHGEKDRPFTIVPPATVTPLREAVLAAGKSASLDLRVRAGRDAITGRVELALPAGWTATPASHALSLAKAGDETTVRFAVRPGAKAAAGDATPVVRIADTTWSLREDVIDHDHIPMQVVLRPATVRLVPLALRVPAGRIAYVRGSGDSIPADLAHVGFSVDELEDETLRTGDLGRYAAIVLGIRAYNTRTTLRLAHARLLAYVERGGTLIVQYNTRDLDGPIGPFSLELGRERITDETAAPVFLDAKHALVQRPNQITTADFDGWIQERGIYFGSKWDARYKPLLRFSDPGEGPLDGSLLVAQHGKGRYIYTGLAFFRQLPAGVPGAYRLFANLIGGGK